MKKISVIKTIIKFVLVIAAVGCTKEVEIHKPSMPDAPFTVQEARLWFDTNLQSLLHAHVQGIAKSGASGYQSLIPFFDWSRAITGFNEDWSVVELPWRYKDGKVVFSRQGSGSNATDLSFGGFAATYPP